MAAHNRMTGIEETTGSALVFPAEEGGPRAAHYAALSLFFVVVLVYGSLVPFHFRPISVARASAHFCSQPLFVRPEGKNRIDWCANFLITIPLSMFALGALLVGRRRRSHLLWAVPVVLIGSIGLSVSIEFLQSWFPPRVPSLSDVTAQSVGVFVGIGFWLTVGRTIGEAVRDFQRIQRPPDRIDWLLHIYVVALLIHSVLPLDVLFSPGELLQKYHDGRVELIPFSFSYESIWWMLYERGINLLLFIPVGMWSAIAGTLRGRSLRPQIPAVLLGLGVVVGIEAVQLLIITRFSSTTDIVLGATGVLVGCRMMRWWRKKTDPPLSENLSDTPDTQTGPMLRWLTATGLYTLFLMSLSWMPFNFLRDVDLIKAHLRGFWSISFSQYASASFVARMTGILREVVWFVPLGILLANVVFRITTARSLRRVLLAAGCVMIGGVSLAIELGQVFLPGRVANVTGALLAMTVGVGAMLTTAWMRTADSER